MQKGHVSKKSGVIIFLLNNTADSNSSTWRSGLQQTTMWNAHSRLGSSQFLNGCTVYIRNIKPWLWIYRADHFSESEGRRHFFASKYTAQGLTGLATTAWLRWWEMFERCHEHCSSRIGRWWRFLIGLTNGVYQFGIYHGGATVCYDMRHHIELTKHW